MSGMLLDVPSVRRAGAPSDTDLRILGMHCAACAGLVESALLGVDGVASVSVNMASERARVRADPVRAPWPLLAAALRRAGYEALPDHPDTARQLRRAEARAALWRLFVGAFCAMQVMMLAAPAQLADAGDLAPDLRRLLDWGAWVMTLPVVLFAAKPFLEGAWRAMRSGRIGMDVPVALGIAITFVASSGAAFDPAGPFGGAVYFDSLSMFVSFLLLGRWLELRMRHRAAEALEAATGTMPETALRLTSHGRDERVPIDRLRIGDRLRVPIGEAFPADGVVLEGRSHADESLLTGESKPVLKQPGEHVVGGSLNRAAPLVMQVERFGPDTRYAAIVALMTEAATQRPSSARWADRWAAPFLWTVLLLAAGAAAVWSVIDPARAVWVAVSVLIVTCPCALSLATPSALLAAAHGLARDGVLLRRIDALEALAEIDRLFFDKTGTLTGAEPHFREVEPLVATIEMPPSEVLRIAASLAAWSHHPLSRALIAAAPLAGSRTAWFGVREQAGAGIEAIDAAGTRWRLGAAAWAGRDATTPADATGLVAYLGRDGVLLATLHFDETLGEDVADALSALRADGVALSLLSGDAPRRVQRLAARLGIDAADALGGASPEEKLRVVERAQSRGERVGMVGDGINDAPVLARADVSIAMGEGALVARANADAIVVSNRLHDLVHARALARRTVAVIRQNIAWAATYNAVCVPLALLGMLPPWAAGLGMAASSLLVVGNSLRLQR